MAATIGNTSTVTYDLTLAAQNPLTVAPPGLILIDSGVPQAAGIHGVNTYAWTVTNLGTVESVGVQGIGIALDGGGLIINGANGSAAGYIAGQTAAIEIEGTPASTGTILNYGLLAGGSTASQAPTDAVFTASNVSATIVNFGTISDSVSATPTIGATGVLMNGGGILVNSDLIEIAQASNADGVQTFNAAATVQNSGTIIAIGSISGTGVQLTSGSLDNSGLISGSLVGVNLFPGTVANVSNAGTIAGVGNIGLALGGGGTIVNAEAGLIAGYNTGVLAGPATLTNYGTIAARAAANGVAVQLDPGGSVFNGRAGSTAALITAAFTGIGLFGAPGTIVNFGVIAATLGGTTGTVNANGVNLGGGGAVSNLGTIAAPAANNGAAVNLGYGGGLLVNGTSGSTLGLVSAYHGAVNIFTGTTGNSGTVVNYGLIESTQEGTAAGTGFTGFGISVGGAPGTIDNLGTIAALGTAGGDAVSLNAGGFIRNGESGATAGLIVGAYGAIGVNAAAAGIANFATIAATGTSGSAIFLGAGGTVANSGVISASLTAGAAIQIGDGGAGTIVNSGTIEASGANANGAGFGAGGGALVNQSNGVITAYHNGVGWFFPGTIANSVILTIVNHGHIQSTQPGTAAGTGFSGFAIITSANSTTTVDNFGTIAASQTAGGGAILLAGGEITNEASGLIAGATAITVDGAATIIDFGTIAGTGGMAIALGAGTDQVVIEAGSQLVGAVGNFLPGDSFDLPFLASNGTGSVALQSHQLQIVASAGAFAIDLDPNQNFAGAVFHLAVDDSGGTLVTETLGQVPPRDFDGNGASDLLWRNSDGNVAIWEMSGGTAAASGLAGFADPAGWTIRGTGDFDGDGKADILWQDNSGDVAVWEMNGTSIAASGLAGFADPTSWSIEATGDFDGDGKSDILWQDTSGDVAIWQMDGSSVAASGLVGFADPTSWHIRGTGDFNGDGRSDVLWQDNSGNVAIWEMNGFSVAASAAVGYADSSVWHIRGTGDFAGDGRSDILWQDSSGDVAIWEMNGLSVAASGLVGFADPATWHIAGIGDYDGDGKSDILWQDKSGDVAAWEMDGFSVTASTLVGFADPSWSIVPPDNTGDTNAAGGSLLPVADIAMPPAAHPPITPIG